MKFILFLCIALSTSGLLNAQVFFNRNYYDFPYTNTFGFSRTVFQTSDNQFVVAGANDSRDKISVLKLSNVGDTIWSFTKNFGTTYDYHMIFEGLEASDGNYVFAGYYYSSFENDENGIIFKLDATNGNLQWLKIIDIQSVEEIFALKETGDKGFAIAGSIGYLDSTNNTITEIQAFLFKLDSLGNTEWMQNYGGSSNDYFMDLVFTEQKEFLLYGGTFSFGNGFSSTYLVKTDSLGNMLWQKTYGGIGADAGNGIHPLQDGNYVIAGQSQFSTDSTGAYIAKIDPDGNLLWSKLFKGTQDFQDFEDVNQLPNGNIVACGMTQLNYSGTRYQGILKCLSPIDGSLVWEKQYKQSVADSMQYPLYSMDVCSDGGVVMSGHIWDLHTIPTVNLSYYVVKTDCKGNAATWSSTCSQLGMEELDASTESWFSVFPNPSTRQVQVKWLAPDNSKNHQLLIYNTMGQCIQTVSLQDASPLELNIQHFPAGVYSVVYTVDQHVLQTQKLVKID